MFIFILGIHILVHNVLVMLVVDTVLAVVIGKINEPRDLNSKRLFTVFNIADYELIMNCCFWCEL